MASFLVPSGLDVLVASYIP